MKRYVYCLNKETNKMALNSGMEMGLKNSDVVEDINGGIKEFDPVIKR